MDIKSLTKQIEKVSKLYASKFDIDRDKDWYIIKLQEELGELIQSYLMMIGQARTKGKTKKEITTEFEKEVADVLCHVLLLSNFYKIDLEKVIEEKWLKWNKVD